MRVTDKLKAMTPIVSTSPLIKLFLVAADFIFREVNLLTKNEIRTTPKVFEDLIMIATMNEILYDAKLLNVMPSTDKKDM